MVGVQCRVLRLRLVTAVHSLSINTADITGAGLPKKSHSKDQKKPALQDQQLALEVLQCLTGSDFSEPVLNNQNPRLPWYSADPNYRARFTNKADGKTAQACTDTGFCLCTMQSWCQATAFVGLSPQD